jgi:hypothetical protein
MADHETPLRRSDEVAAELEAVRAEQKRWTDAFDIYAGNNPDKYLSDIQHCAREVARLEELLRFLRERGE